MYKEIDKKIVEAVKKGNNRFKMIQAYCPLLAMRTIDKRLQSLRKRGLLSFSQWDGWR